MGDEDEIGIVAYRHQSSSGISKCGCFGVVIDEVDLSVFGILHFESFGQGNIEDVAVHAPWVFPLRCFGEMIHKVDSALVVAQPLPT